MIFANTVQQEGTIIYGGGDDGALCVRVCRKGGWGELGLFDNVRFHVCASALHLAKHPAGTSDNIWIHSGTLLIKAHTHTHTHTHVTL